MTEREIIEKARPYQDSRGNWCAGKSEIAGSVESVTVGGLPGGGTVTFIRKEARCNCLGERTHYFTVWVKEGGEDRIFRCTRCYVPIVYFPPCAA